MNTRIKTFIIFIMLSFLMGCASTDKEIEQIDKTLLNSENVKIYNIDINDILKDRNQYKKLHQFPFINTNAALDFRGHFPIDFYQSFNYQIKAVSLKNVNFWRLRNYPLSIDVIYVEPIWIENYKFVTNDLFENICYSNNVSKKEQNILKWWIKNGGILWVESSIYATGFENITKNGKINLKALENRLYKLTRNLHFLDYPVNFSIYLSLNNELTSYKRKVIQFLNLQSKVTFFSDINVLQINMEHPIEAFFALKSNNIFKDKHNNTILSINNYFQGKIISLFPFDYVDSYKDGELLRWKLLQYLFYIKQRTPYVSKSNQTVTEVKKNSINNKPQKIIKRCYKNKSRKIK